jgi:hypothetical protein
VDTRMGQPIRSHIRISQAEFIGLMRASRGTETSKYPEEKKENSIPPVAASEAGIAQTLLYGVRGCRTLEVGVVSLAEENWKVPAKKVKPL